MEQTTSEVAGSPVRSVQRVCDILDLLKQTVDGASLSDVADSTALPKSTVFRYLATLEARGYVQREASTGAYHAGPGLSPPQSQWVELLRNEAIPHLERLRAEFGETVNLGILEGSRVCYLTTVESLRGVRLAVRPGHRDPIHSTALGKAVCSTLSDEQVTAMLAEAGMERRTAHTLTTLRAYLEDLEDVRRRGYAMDDGENEPDGRCIAVPLPGTVPCAALSLSAPSARFPRDRADVVAKALRHTAAELVRAASPAAAAER